MPLFSIIIPTLNEERFLPKLLSSIALQSFTDYEVIISDGNSHDETLKVAKRFSQEVTSLICVKNEKAGLPYQRNQGAKEAKGKWLLFIDADTILLPYCLERLDQLLTEHKDVQHFTPWYAVDGEKSQDALLTLVINGTMEGGLLTKRPAALGPFAGFSRKAFDKVNGYNETLEWGEDNDISRRAYEKGIVLKIFRETLAIYSLRRFKKQGTLNTARVYVQNIFLVLLTKKSPTSVPGYIMGGHLYTEEERKTTLSKMKQFQIRLKKLTKELFE